MTTEEIQERIEKIKSCMGDYENAHSLEDDLRNDFIKYVSEHPELSYYKGLATRARLILSTNDLDFPRYCA